MGWSVWKGPKWQGQAKQEVWADLASERREGLGESEHSEEPLVVCPENSLGGHSCLSGQLCSPPARSSECVPVGHGEPSEATTAAWGPPWPVL